MPTVGCSQSILQIFLQWVEPLKIGVETENLESTEKIFHCVGFGAERYKIGKRAGGEFLVRFNQPAAYSHTILKGHTKWEEMDADNTNGGILKKILLSIMG